MTLEMEVKKFYIECKECKEVNCELDTTEHGDIIIWCNTCGEEEVI
jgi:Zn finger protein HypA/HybF involved in hydrogenase expression